MAKSEITPERLTVSQKALLEKTIKLRHNGMIQALQSTETEVEELSKPIELGSYLTDSALEGPAIPEEIAIVHAKLRAGHEPFRAAQRAVYKRYDKLSEAEHNRHRRATAALQKEREATAAKLDRERNKKRSAFLKLVHTENKRRATKLQAAKAARRRVVVMLREQRDEAIIKAAFQGEGAGVLAFLDTLPTPESVGAMLGLTLAKRLPMVTGIGERNPKALTEDGGFDPS